MHFPASASIPPELAGLDLPILGRDSPLLEPWRSAAQAVLSEESITTAMLRVPGLRRPHFGQATRRLFVAAANFSLSPPEADAPPADASAPPSAGKRPADRSKTKRPTRFSRTLSFDLPRGAYATVLLRALGQ
jgi:tRNA(Glu) U13 pseudouridine synthase TruD